VNAFDAQRIGVFTQRDRGPSFRPRFRISRQLEAGRCAKFSPAHAPAVPSLPRAAQPRVHVGTRRGIGEESPYAPIAAGQKKFLWTDRRKSA
jgi:hypothetical protein